VFSGEQCIQQTLSYDVVYKPRICMIVCGRNTALRQSCFWPNASFYSMVGYTAIPKQKSWCHFCRKTWCPGRSVTLGALLLLCYAVFCRKGCISNDVFHCFFQKRL